MEFPELPEGCTEIPGYRFLCLNPLDQIITREKSLDCVSGDHLCVLAIDVDFLKKSGISKGAILEFHLMALHAAAFALMALNGKTPNDTFFIEIMKLCDRHTI